MSATTTTGPADVAWTHTEHLLADTLTATEDKALKGAPKADARTGVMLALYPDAATAKALALPGGLPADELHVTVAYLGKTDQVDPDKLAALARVVASRPGITGSYSGLARFTNTGDDRGDALVALYDSKGLEDLRADARAAMAAAGIEIPSEHGFCAHTTLAYLDPGDDLPVQRLEARDATFGALAVVHGEDRTDVPFRDAPETKAAPAQVGEFVAVDAPELRGRVDLVVTAGTVPGALDWAGEPVAGTKDHPAARVVLYAPTGRGTWTPTGDKLAVPAAALPRVAPLRTREVKSLDEALAMTLAEHDDPPVDGAALRDVYQRGLDSWPGEQVTTLTAEQWALGRVDAFTATAADPALRPAGYVGDDDLLPPAPIT